MNSVIRMAIVCVFVILSTNAAYSAHRGEMPRGMTCGQLLYSIRYGDIHLQNEIKRSINVQINGMQALVSEVGLSHGTRRQRLLAKNMMSNDVMRECSTGESPDAELRKILPIWWLVSLQFFEGKKIPQERIIHAVEKWNRSD